MTKFVALNISISEDGYMAGPNQSLENPMGEGGMPLHGWVFPTKAFREQFGNEGGEIGKDNDYVTRGFTNIGASILGRNMFGPVRREWGEENWRGWWGEEPVFKHPVFVLTHYARESIHFGNGTVFHFITEGVERAHALALESANGKDVRVGGGASTLRQFLELGLLDELHLAVSPIKLGEGEILFANPDLQLKHYRQVASVQTSIEHKTFLKI